MQKNIILFIAVLSWCCLACEPKNPNVDNSGNDELKSLEVTQPIDTGAINFQDEIYVPIYSDIYIEKSNQKALLAATLSIRNTSYRDTLFISKIDYFNTEGDLVRSYLEGAIRLPPMGTVNYVIERDDDTGGAGANFMVGLSAKNKDIKPIIQAIMIGHVGNIGFSFATDGYSVK
ncbi:MAG: DUF3124 domain-containing protein [Bacteroidota bacterium]